MLIYCFSLALLSASYLAPMHPSRNRVDHTFMIKLHKWVVFFLRLSAFCLAISLGFYISFFKKTNIYLKCCFVS